MKFASTLNIVLVLLMTNAFSIGTANARSIKSQSRVQQAFENLGVNKDALNYALDYYYSNQQNITNSRYVSIVDFTMRSNEDRFFLMDMVKGTVKRFRTAHGSGSDAGHDGYAERFSNQEGSNQSSVGIYLTGKMDPKSDKPLAMKLHGMEDTNDQAFDPRGIIIHAAYYMTDEWMNKNDMEIPGRSQGCFSLTEKDAIVVTSKIKLGSVLLGWHPDHMSH